MTTVVVRSSVPPPFLAFLTIKALRSIVHIWYANFPLSFQS